jgi:hypothetical protein
MNVIHVFRLLGLTYTVIGLAILLHPRYYKRMIDDYVRSAPAMFLNGFMVLAIGYLFLAVHNAWTNDLPVIVTVIGWLALVKGVVILLVPNVYVRIARFMNIRFLKFEALVTLVVGVILLYLSFLR